MCAPDIKKRGNWFVKILWNYELVEPEKILVQAPTTSYTVTGLLAYTEYQFNVRAATVENDVDLWGNFSSMAVTRTEAAGTSFNNNVYM